MDMDAGTLQSIVKGPINCGTNALHLGCQPD